MFAGSVVDLAVAVSSAYVDLTWWYWGLHYTDWAKSGCGRLARMTQACAALMDLGRW